MTYTIGIEEKIPARQQVSLARIMVATDFSPVSNRALDYAVSLARRFGSQIYLTHVITYGGHGVMEPDLGAPMGEELQRIAHKQAQEVVDSGRLYGVPYEVVIEEGTLRPALECLLDKYKIDLLVLGTHGMSGPLKVLFGSSAEEIFRQARLPVMTVGPVVKEEAPFETEFKNILLATNFGPGAEREATFALALAQEHRSKLILLHVIPHPDNAFDRDTILERERITNQLRELVPAGSELLCKPEFHLAYGQPVEEILRVAKVTEADLIVIGAKKRGSLSGHIPATKAFGVVRGARCPVLTIKS
ncbi:MAG TPA: universal stress protein [Candidatus Acidoferrales bacterium]|nr:universal stress protein [Candidatus Acidoferrales bacterium]